MKKFTAIVLCLLCCLLLCLCHCKQLDSRYPQRGRLYSHNGNCSPNGGKLVIEKGMEKYDDTDYSTSVANSSRFTAEQPWVMSTTVPVRR